MKLLIDLDEVVFRFLDKLCEEFNSFLGVNSALKEGHINRYIMTDDFKEWELQDIIGDNFWMFQTEDFFKSLKPYSGAIETLKKLQNDGFTIYLASDAMSNGDIIKGKLTSIEEHLPFIPKENIFFTSKKWEIKADLIFDDKYENVANFSGIKVINDRLYNRYPLTLEDSRIYSNNWDDFLDICEYFNTVKKYNM